MLRVKKLSWPIYERFLNAQEHTVGKIIIDKSKLLPPRIQLSTEKTAPRGGRVTHLTPQHREKPSVGCVG